MRNATVLITVAIQNYNFSAKLTAFWTTQQTSSKDPENLRLSTAKNFFVLLWLY